MLAALCAACGGNREQVRRDAQSSLKLGIAYLTEGRASPGLQELTRAEKLTPEDPEIQLYLGAGYRMRREPALAEEKFRRAVELKPDYSEAWNNLGTLYLEQGRPDQAIPALEKALQNVFYGTPEYALNNLGWALFLSGRVEEAQKRLQEAVEMAPSFPPARKNLAAVLQERQDWQGALKQLDVLLRVNPDDAEANLKRGVSLVKLGDREAARGAFEKAWRLAPGAEIGKSAKTYLDLLQ